MAANKLIPTAICTRAKKFMRGLLEALESKSIDSKLDAAAIELIGFTYHNYITATQIIEEEGLIITQVTNAGENLKAHPAVKIQLDAQTQLTRLLIEFGLTPRSRKDVVSAKSSANDIKSPLDDFLGRTREIR